MSNYFDQFRAAMQQHGFIPPADFVADGKPHSFDSEGNGGKKKGWYILHNCTVSYLVLARYSQRDNLTTGASVAAIERHTGIARSRARTAIENLEFRLLSRVSTSTTKPRYKFFKAVDLQSVRESLPAFPKKRFDETDSDYQLRYDEVESGRQKHMEQDFIWLPNEIINGVGNETPPIEKIRQDGDVMLLRLFVDLYHAQNLRDDGGINRLAYFQEYDRVNLGERGEFVVWGFRRNTEKVCEIFPIDAHYVNLTKAEKEVGKNQAHVVFSRLKKLQAFGLLGWIPFLFESAERQAEPIHGYSSARNDEIDYDLAVAAYSAAYAMLPEGVRRRVENEEYLIAPVLRHYANVQMIGVARLTYRPKTKMTAAWQANRVEYGKIFLDSYHKLVQAAAKVAA